MTDKSADQPRRVKRPTASVETNEWSSDLSSSARVLGRRGQLGRCCRAIATSGQAGCLECPASCVVPEFLGTDLGQPV